MALSVIIPVHNGGEGLRLCLRALETGVRPPDEVIVVDDASTDGSADLAESLGARVISLPGGPWGPARARNQGAAAAQGEILLFLDADVVVHTDTLAQVEREMAGNPEAAALFGSYDASPAASGFVSRYKNLLHHYVHQHGRREASTFWAGCGAVRQKVFTALGGFDERYRRPSVEDIEMGLRLRRAGYRIRLCPDIQVNHLKAWTLGGLLQTDIRDRAIPWTRLIVSNSHLPDDLNLDKRHRGSALAAWAAVVFFLGGCRSPLWWLGLIPVGAALWALNADLYRFFRRQGGGSFAVGAATLHLLYLLYSSLVFVVVAARVWLGRKG